MQTKESPLALSNTAESFALIRPWFSSMKEGGEWNLCLQGKISQCVNNPPYPLRKGEFDALKNGIVKSIESADFTPGILKSSLA